MPIGLVGPSLYISISFELLYKGSIVVITQPLQSQLVRFRPFFRLRLHSPASRPPKFSLQVCDGTTNCQTQLTAPTESCPTTVPVLSTSCPAQIAVTSSLTCLRNSNSADMTFATPVILTWLAATSSAPSVPNSRWPLPELRGG